MTILNIDIFAVIFKKKKEKHKNIILDRRRYIYNQNTTSNPKVCCDCNHYSILNLVVASKTAMVNMTKKLVEYFYLTLKVSFYKYNIFSGLNSK